MGKVKIEGFKESEYNPHCGDIIIFKDDPCKESYMITQHRSSSCNNIFNNETVYDLVNLDGGDTFWTGGFTLGEFKRDYIEQIEKVFAVNEYEMIIRKV
jgi:hypothetical protein